MKCKWCNKEAYAWRTTRWGKDAVCRDCIKNYPYTGSFEPFEKLKGVKDYEDKCM